MLSVVTVNYQTRITCNDLDNSSIGRNFRRCVREEFSKIVSKCCNMKPKGCHLLYIPQTTESVQAGSYVLQLLYNPGNSYGHRACKYYDGHIINIHDSFNAYLHEDSKLHVSNSNPIRTVWILNWNLHDDLKLCLNTFYITAYVSCQLQAIEQRQSMFVYCLKLQWVNPALFIIFRIL
jgi:hypothetical protein